MVKQRTKKLLKKLRMELLVGRKTDILCDSWLKQKKKLYVVNLNHMQKAPERDVKIARIANIRKYTCKRIKVLKQQKYIDPKSVENIGSNMYESNKDISSNTNEA